MTNRDNRERAAFRCHGDHSTWPDATNAWVENGGDAPTFDLCCAVEEYDEVRTATLREVLALFDAKGANLPTRDDVAALLEKP